MEKCNDKWDGEDKIKHFVVCFILALVSPLLAIIIAIAKEAYDLYQPNNHWCWKDLVVDALGICGGAIVGALLF